MLHQLKHNEFSITSTELITPQNYAMTFYFDIDPKECHDFAPISINPINENFIILKQIDFVLKILRAWFKNSSIPKLQTKNLTLTGEKRLSHYFTSFELLQTDEDTDLLYMTTLAELELSPLTGTQVFLHPNRSTLLFTEPTWLDFSGHYGQNRTHNQLKLRFWSRGLRVWNDLLIKICYPCQTNKAPRMYTNTPAQ